MSMRVLVIESDEAFLKTLKGALERNGFNVCALKSVDDASDFLEDYEYDIIILNTQLADTGGNDFLKKMRIDKISAPVIMISLKSDINLKIASFNAGADDFLVRPFHMDELAVRIHAIIRRSKGHCNSVIRTGSLSLNLNSKTVEIHGSRIHLTGKEYAILELLSLRKGTTLTKEMFLNHLYDDIQEPGAKIIDVFICKLRKKMMQACNGFSHIETIWGRGYILKEDDDLTIPL